MMRAESSLLHEAIELASHLDVETALSGLVKAAARLTGARYAAIGVLDSRGETEAFVHVGFDEETVTRLGRPPRGHGLLGAIPPDGPLVLDDLSTHPTFRGFPAGHPPMTEFIGLPVNAWGRIYGRLYLANKEGGFTDADIETLTSLAEAAGVAVANARVYAEATARERWSHVSNEITTALLEGTEEEEVLHMIAHRLRIVAEADTALIILPSIADTWVCEIADGLHANNLVGVVFPEHGRAVSVIREGIGLMVDSMDLLRNMRVPELASFGPALYAPMVVRGESRGVIVLLRDAGGPEFDPAALDVAEKVAEQAVLALELATARHTEDLAALSDERSRIARDLHDLAIQQLFGTGMQLTRLRDTVLEAGTEATDRVIDDIAEALNEAVDAVDSSVREIRTIVRSLREMEDDTIVIVERLRTETSQARSSLGFAPSLIITVDGHNLRDGEPASDELANMLHARLDPDVGDDVVAVVREGLTNAAKHAHASSATVRVGAQDPNGDIIVEVEDDGQGIDTNRIRSSGLTNLASRARRHRGSFQVTRGKAGRGTRLTWQAPLAGRD